MKILIYVVYLPALLPIILLNAVLGLVVTTTAVTFRVREFEIH